MPEIKWDVTDEDDIARAEAEFKELNGKGVELEFKNDANDPNLEAFKGAVKEFDACYGNLVAKAKPAPKPAPKTKVAPKTKAKKAAKKK